MTIPDGEDFQKTMCIHRHVEWTKLSELRGARWVCIDCSEIFTSAWDRDEVRDKDGKVIGSLGDL
jgi:hypothetical protein